jgi:hypothetical protein
VQNKWCKNNAVKLMVHELECKILWKSFHPNLFQIPIWISRKINSQQFEKCAFYIEKSWSLTLRLKLNKITIQRSHREENGEQKTKHNLSFISWIESKSVWLLNYRKEEGKRNRLKKSKLQEVIYYDRLLYT